MAKVWGFGTLSISFIYLLYVPTVCLVCPHSSPLLCWSYVDIIKSTNTVMCHLTVRIPSQPCYLTSSNHTVQHLLSLCTKSTAHPVFRENSNTTLSITVRLNNCWVTMKTSDKSFEDFKARIPIPC